MPKGNTAVLDRDEEVMEATVNETEDNTNRTSEAAADLDKDVAEISVELEVLQAKVGGLTIAIDNMPAGTPEAAMVALRAEKDKLLSQIERRQKSLDRLTEQQRYGQWTQPFLSAISKIDLSTDSAGADRAPVAVTIDSEEIAKARRNAYVILDALDAVEAARDTHLSGIPAEVWDALVSKKIHFKFETDPNSDVTYLGGAFAAGKRAAGATGRSRGVPITYKVIGLPENYSGPAQIGDMFGPGTDNPVGKNYAEEAGGTDWSNLIAERTSDGKGGRVSAASGLRTIGFILEEQRAEAGTEPDDDEPDDDELDADE